MTATFYVVCALSLGAIGATVWAILCAREGYEDEEGFHAIRRNKEEPRQTAGNESEQPSVPPYASPN